LEASITLSLSLNASALIITSLALLPIIATSTPGTRMKTRDRHFFTALLLHFAGLFVKLASVLAVADGAPRFLNPYTLTTIALEMASAITLILGFFTDEDGKYRFFNRKRPLLLSLFVSLLIPTLLSLILEILVQGTLFLAFAYSLSLSLCCFFNRLEKERQLEEREQQLTVRQARVLTRQMQPHFIFNSLASIEALCILDPEKAAACVENLAGYLRGNIDGMVSDELIPFETELSHIRQYVALEQADPARQFTIDYELGVMDFRLPALTVQPIVENAVKHGALSHTDGSGRVLLRTEEIGSLIRVTVEDNGLAAEGLTEKQKEHRGIGLQNSEERLATQCGGSLTVKRGENGVRAVILIPRGGKNHGHVDG
jgi:hypothetical protein